jgi:hypothetical protein
MNCIGQRNKLVIEGRVDAAQATAGLAACHLMLGSSVSHGGWTTHDCSAQRRLAYSRFAAKRTSLVALFSRVTVPQPQAPAAVCQYQMSPRRTGNSADTLPFYRETGVLQLRHGVPSMCDYSLELVSSRPAKVGDKLVSAGFPHDLARVCLCGGPYGGCLLASWHRACL